MHIGIIMDGNRRWAKKRGLPKLAGHKAGADTLGKLLKICPKYGVDTLTLYAFSTENMNRKEEEVDNLFKLISRVAKSNIKHFKKSDTKVKILGKVESIPEKYRKKILELEDKTSNCKTNLVQICINYGGRDEIIRSIKRALEKAQEITEENITNNLDSPLEPELIVRTGGNQRLSNFLMWQGTYSELYFTTIFWPDFDEEELKKALDFYNSQKRNFGK